MKDFGTSTALASTPGLGAETKRKIEDALALLRQLGLKEPDQQLPGERGLAGRLGPIDGVVADWDEIKEPSVLGGKLPFRRWQCEALLNQALDLLERCVAERATYDALRER